MVNEAAKPYGHLHIGHEEFARQFFKLLHIPDDSLFGLFSVTKPPEGY